MIEEVRLHEQKMTVWYGIFADMVVELLYFENECAETSTLNHSIRSVIMTTVFLMTTVRENCMEHLLFQQHGSGNNGFSLFPVHVISKKL